jgi:type IV pilus assembly protein PilA
MLKAIQNKTRDDKGFTLIELMVVVLIIAILIAIAIPTFLGMRRRAQDRAAQSDLRNGLTAAKAFYTDDDTYTGFTPGATGTAEAAEPSLDWLATAPVDQRDVQIDEATGNVVHLISRSNSGSFFCVRDSGGNTTFGPDPAGAPATLIGGVDEAADCNFQNW